MFLKEFNKNNGDRWYKQVVLKDVKSNISINEEIQQLLAMSPPMSSTPMSTPMSQQRRLEKKISKDSHKIIIFDFIQILILKIYISFA